TTTPRHKTPSEGRSVILHYLGVAQRHSVRWWLYGIRLSVLVALEHFARAAILGRADDALLLQQVDQLGRLAIADPQPALQQRGRGALVLLDQLDRLRQQLILLLHTQKFAWPFAACGFWLWTLSMN